MRAKRAVSLIRVDLFAIFRARRCVRVRAYAGASDDVRFSPFCCGSDIDFDVDFFQQEFLLRAVGWGGVSGAAGYCMCIGCRECSRRHSQPARCSCRLHPRLYLTAV